MDPWTLFILLLILAAAFAMAESVIPSHGVLGVMAGLCGLGAVGVAFAQNRWVGLGTLVALMIVGPVVATLLVKVWQRTPAGKAIVLTAVTPPVEHERVKPGDQGRTVTVLRPMGEAEFGVLTVQVISEFGTIDPGQPIRVTSLTPDGIARVRAIEHPAGTTFS